MSDTNHGEILRKAISTKGLSLTDVSKRMRIGRKTLYRRFDQEKIDYYELLRFGKVLEYDFSKDIPEIAMYLDSFSEMVEEPGMEYLKSKQELTDCKRSLNQYRDEAYKLARELNEWKDKYIQAIEEIGKLKLELKSH